MIYFLFILCKRLTELKQRFEPPNDQNRWDSPLFKVFNVPITTSTTTGEQNSLQSSSLIDTSDRTSKGDLVQLEKVVKKSSWKPKHKVNEYMVS